LLLYQYIKKWDLRQIDIKAVYWKAYLDAQIPICDKNLL